MQVICRLNWYRLGAAGCNLTLTVAELKEMLAMSAELKHKWE